jgi:hypothetical protein
MALALGALYYVLQPILKPAPPRHLAPPDEGGADAGNAAPVMQDAIDALREVEFDKATGKLSESDYASLKSRYTEAALAAMRAEDAGSPQAGAVAGSGADEDDAERLIRRFRQRASACVPCGPRPEPDARFCSSCGRFLGGTCGKCGSAASEPGARFCSSCGAALAA